MDFGSYTLERENVLIDELSSGYDETWDFTKLLELLNSDSFFRPFSERIRVFISNYTGQEYTPNEAYLFMFNKMKSSGITPNRNTLKKWFNVRNDPEGDSGPKMGDDGRNAMFEVAFALGLSASETEDFFHKVFLDKAFNIRNPVEFIYRNCISNNKPYSEAKALIDKLYFTDSTELPAGTMYLKESADDIAGGDELLEFIAEHPDSFSFTSRTALSEMHRILNNLTGYDDNEGFAEKEFRNDTLVTSESGSQGRNTHSVDFVLDMLIKGPSGAKKDDSFANPVRDLFLRKEVVNQFPNANTISHPDSSYIIRKNIILLYFYWYWVQDKLEEASGDYEDFKEELNDILISCGYGPLYYGNPFDWIFLFCSAYKDSDVSPLEIFRGLMYQSDGLE